MKIFGPARVSLAHPHGVDLSLEGGAGFSIQVLEPSLFRVRYKPASGYREPRTWAIAPQAGQDVAWTGRLRDDSSGFSGPVAQLSRQDGQLTLRTGALAVTVREHPLALSWHDGQGRLLVSDRATSSYFESQRTGAIRHYLQRDRAERYYGLGDKTGPLDLHGRRLRTLALDSLGYDPQRGDPLYKHWPFVLTRAPGGQWWGIYYDTLAACTFDLGCEHDNYHDLFRYVEIDDGDLDYYPMAGATPGEVIAQFVRLIGGTPGQRAAAVWGLAEARSVRVLDHGIIVTLGTPACSNKDLSPCRHGRTVHTSPSARVRGVWCPPQMKNRRF